MKIHKILCIALIVMTATTGFLLYRCFIQQPQAANSVVSTKYDIELLNA